MVAKDAGIDGERALVPVKASAAVRAAGRGLNALKHGIFAKEPVVAGVESQEEWEAHREGVAVSLAPEGHMEMCLVERVALTLWRLRRVAAFETESMAVELAATEAQWGKAKAQQDHLAAIPFYGMHARKYAKDDWVREREADLLILGAGAGAGDQVRGAPEPATDAGDARAGGVAGAAEG